MPREHEPGASVTLHAIIHEAEEGGYWAEVPELPGCMSQGETQAEVIQNIRAAADAVVQSYKADGEPLPLIHAPTVTSLPVLI